MLPHDVHTYPAEFFCRPSRARSALLVPTDCFAVHRFHGSQLSGGLRLRRKDILTAPRVIGASGFSVVRRLRCRVCERVSGEFGQ